MVAFVPITDIAKLASAFKIIVFVLVNIALIAFREADLESYEPSFETPLYPLPQVFGVAGGLILLPFMGVVPVLGAVAITVGSLLWYYTYVRRRGDFEREGAAAEAIRQRLSEHVVSQTKSVVEQDRYDVFVAVTEQTNPEREETLLRVATAVARAQNGTIQVSRFDEVPDQTPLDTAKGQQTAGDRSFEDLMEEYISGADVPIEYEEIVSHETKHAIVNHAEFLGANAILLERRREELHTAVFGSDIGWIKRHAPCDVIEIEDRGIDTTETVSVVSDRGPYDAVKIMLADALAVEADANVELVFAVDPSAPTQQREKIDEYLTELTKQFEAPVSTRLIEAEDRAAGLTKAIGGTDLVIISAGRDGIMGSLLGRPSDRIIDSIDCTAVVVSAGKSRPRWLRRFFENRVF
jgi:nucleotide-binding universal stress UspA family protein